MARASPAFLTDGSAFSNSYPLALNGLRENYRPCDQPLPETQPNEDWTYYLWRDSDAKLRPSSPRSILNTGRRTRRFKDNLQRSDAIRYVILLCHRFGGIYLDGRRVACSRSLVSHASGGLPRPGSGLERWRRDQNLLEADFSAMNSVMGSEYKESPTSGSGRWTLLPPSVASPLMDNHENWKWLCRKAKKLGSSGFGWADIGCRMLETKNWHLGSADKSTIVVHRFLHLGYQFPPP
uniref:Calpain catalytic domain-containing protein n=1 Tax=Macrostomum lignano TaxID=282301 RepID=A0A1I8FMH7_9PLAT